MARIAINGLGRIGRAALKIIMDTPELEAVAINDLLPPENLAYLFKFDTVYGRYPKNVSSSGDSLIIGDKKIRIFNSKDLRSFLEKISKSMQRWNVPGILLPKRDWKNI